MLKRLLTLFCFIFVLGVSSQALAQADIEAVVNSDPAEGVFNPDGSKTTLPAGCQTDGEFARAYRYNAAKGYYQAIGRVEQAFYKAIPTPATAGNCLSNIFNSVLSSFGGFTWPPNWGSLLNNFINNLMNKLCKRLWQAIASSSWVANYNNIVNGFNAVGRCTGNLAGCRPIASATNDMLSGLLDF